MSDHLNEIVLMLDSLFKGLTDIGLILSYNVQIQKISMNDVTETARIKNTIFLLIKRLKKMYSTLSCCDRNGNNVVSKGNTIIDTSSREKILKQNNYSKVSNNDNNCEQGTGEIFITYAPFSLNSTVNEKFLSDSSVVSRVNELNQNCTDNSLVNAECFLQQNQTGSTNPALPDKLSSLLDLGKAETNTERNGSINTIEVFNVDSIIISEDSLRNWNALHAINKTGDDETTNIEDCRGQSIKVLSSNPTVTSKQDVASSNMVEVIEQENYKCDLQLLRQNIATVLVVKSVSMPESDHLGSQKESPNHSSPQNERIPKITDSECSCDASTDETNTLELNQQCFCTKCKKTFESIEELEEHRKVLHQGHGNFECSICNYRFLTNEELVKHSRKHDNQFKCTDCVKSFATKLGLTRHLENSHEKKKFVCDICGKRFSRSDYLPIHKAGHAGKMMLSCKSCPKKFRYKNQLNLHEKMHSGVKDYICEICSKGFSRNDKLKDHLLRHYNIKRFQCDLCSKTFAEKRDLNTHMKTHHSNKNSSK